MDSNQGYNPYKWVICPPTRVINLHPVTKYPEPLSRWWGHVLFLLVMFTSIWAQKSNFESNQSPDAPCREYLPTFLLERGHF